jgi:phage repressor protein C with HTH and peptisase S24 domain
MSGRVFQFRPSGVDPGRAPVVRGRASIYGGLTEDVRAKVMACHHPSACVLNGDAMPGRHRARPVDPLIQGLRGDAQESGQIGLSTAGSFDRSLEVVHRCRLKHRFSQLSSIDCFTWNSGSAQPQGMLENLSLPERARRIRDAIRASQISKTALAEQLGVSPQAITGWETTGRIGKESLAGLAAATGRPIEYFIREAPPAASWDDVLGYSQAVGLGKGAEAQEYAETHKLKFRAESLAAQGLKPQQLAVMYGEGDSMLPRVRDGDAILFDMGDTRARDGALYVVQVQGAGSNEYQVKRALILDDAVYFTADNPNGDHSWRKPRRADAKRGHIEIIGRVRWIGSWEE